MAEARMWERCTLQRSRGDSSAKVQRPDEVGALRNKKNLVARTQRCRE